MITVEKLKEFEEYHGYFDGFYLQKVKKGLNVTSEREWSLIEDVLRDLRLVKRGLASESFSNKVFSRLDKICEDHDIRLYFEYLANQNW